MNIRILNIRQREIEIFQTKTRCGALPIHPITHTGSSIIKYKMLILDFLKE